MAPLRKDGAGEKDAGASDFAGLDATAQRQRVERIRAKIPDGCESPARQHLTHVCFQHPGGRLRRIVPRLLSEMDVTVPEPGDDGLSRTIEDACILGNVDLAPPADRSDDAARADDHGIQDRSSGRRRIDLGADESENPILGMADRCRRAEDQHHAERDGRQVADHGRDLISLMWREAQGAGHISPPTEHYASLSDSQWYSPAAWVACGFDSSEIGGRALEAGCTEHEIAAITGIAACVKWCATPGRTIRSSSPRRRCAR